MSNPKKPRNTCLSCDKETARPGYKYCSNKCQIEYQHRIYIQKWKEGEIIGLQRIGVVSVHIKNYLREKFHNRCCLCGWDRLNVKLGYSPLVADHIDGNWRNNCENNLRLICPNCDALTLTYGGMNRGRGRENRAVSKRSIEGGVIFKKRPN